MIQYESVKHKLKKDQKKWLVTGVSGFIGSNILLQLLKLNQNVIGIDNFSTSSSINLDRVKKQVGNSEWDNFKFFEADINDYSKCLEITKDINYVSHQAALGSVPRSIDNPLNSNSSNISGFLNIIYASMLNNVDSFTYAASSSTYGDHESLPKIEENIGNPLSPYAVTKYVNELYAGVFARVYNFKSIGLRYFNVFGPHQDPNGPYAAVIPRWIRAVLDNKQIEIFGDGSTSRDFCFIDNVVQANILSAVANKDSKDKVYNIAVGDRTTLIDLYKLIKTNFSESGINFNIKEKFNNFRDGDVKHSQASIDKAKKYLGYAPSHDVERGIKETVGWYLNEKFK